MFYWIAFAVLIFGCAHRDHLRTNTFLTPTSTCQPLSVFDKIVVDQFDATSAYVEEEQYKNVAPFIAAETPEKLKDQIEARHMFKTVIRASDCSGRAIRVDGKIYSLTQRHLQFHVGIRGQITNCETGESLFKYDSDDESDSESVQLPGQIASKLADGVQARMTCP